MENNPTFAAAKNIVPMIASNVEQIASECSLPPVLSKIMNDAGLFRLYVPKILGGPELDPISAFYVVELIGKTDGSAGWCSFNGTALTSAVSRLSVEAAKELFGDPPDVSASGSARSSGTAKVVDGGYLVNGRWDYLSGIDHAKCLFLTCTVTDDDGPVRNEDGSRVLRVVALPISQGDIHVNWSTMGLKGTASNEASFVDAFVPESHTYKRTGQPFHENPLYNPSTSILCSWTLAAANALGMARGAIETFMGLAQSDSTNSAVLLRDRTSAQTTTGECEAILQACRSYVLDAVGSMWNSQLHKLDDLMDKAVQARLAITFAIRQSVEVVEKLFYAAGTSAIHDSNDLERYFRDLHVAGQHISGLHSNYEYAGQVLLGASITAPTYS
ncbi:MAG TPA: hypothetical protein DHW65_02655 [Dehalococcoidia bacterium]|nr:hypothetical protein [Chloroflexota bacterium]MQF94544.1 hypothetical protein [SAR202 cluster bacterium]HCL25234.1 hypothetical protein [Dehalococcoidia bacterium]|tara:strand:+ start:391 stop:1551 length:1161 start_codon:yes stop_codon:yes gene_type:complete